MVTALSLLPCGDNRSVRLFLVVFSSVINFLTVATCEGAVLRTHLRKTFGKEEMPDKKHTIKLNQILKYSI